MYLIKKLLILFVLIKSTTLFSQYDSSSYYLSTKSTTSAGVYKNGRLVRTLWSNVEKPTGTFQFNWNRTSAEFMKLDLDQYTARKKAFLERIKAFAQYIQDAHLVCRSQFLARYFGEKNPISCNICDICTSTKD